MSISDDARRALPEHPSSEHLRKQAKRLAKLLGVQLAEAQQKVAAGYGFAGWAALMAHVRSLAPQAPLSALARASGDGDVTRVRQLIAAGHDPDDGGADTSPLWEACASTAPDAARLTIAGILLNAGASSRNAVPGQRPLHAVAMRGPASLAELLIRHGAIEWEPNIEGRSALDIARRSRARDKAAMIELFDRPVIRDPSFRAAVEAIYAGEVATLERLLDAEPRLLKDRIREPDCYRLSGRSQYFLDPKLFWFIANNPILVENMPASLPAVARAMIARGVSQEDLDYALGLVMTGSKARENGLQIPLLEVLIDAGARADPEGMGGVLAHGETEIVAHLVSAGMAMTAPIAAALGRQDVLPGLLRAASQRQIDEALDLAVINNRTESARLALEAGATPNRFSSQHSNSQPLHQAALHDNVAMLELLISHGAGLDVVDTLWGGTPLGWARHSGNKEAIAYLEGRLKG